MLWSGVHVLVDTAGSSPTYNDSGKAQGITQSHNSWERMIVSQGPNE